MTPGWTQLVQTTSRLAHEGQQSVTLTQDPVPKNSRQESRPKMSTRGAWLRPRLNVLAAVLPQPPGRLLEGHGWRLLLPKGRPARGSVEQAANSRQSRVDAQIPSMVSQLPRAGLWPHLTPTPSRPEVSCSQVSRGMWRHSQTLLWPRHGGPTAEHPAQRVLCAEWMTQLWIWLFLLGQGLTV